MKKLLAIGLSAIFLVSCTKSAKLTIVNKTNSTLTGMVASGVGFSTAVGSIAPGTEHQVTLDPGPGDAAGLKLEFDADGKHFSEGLSNSPWSGMKEVITTVKDGFTLEYSGVTSF